MDIRITVPPPIGEKIGAAMGARIYENRGARNLVRVYISNADSVVLRRLAEIIEEGGR